MVHVHQIAGLVCCVGKIRYMPLEVTIELFLNVQDVSKYSKIILRMKSNAPPAKASIIVTFFFYAKVPRVDRVRR